MALDTATLGCCWPSDVEIRTGGGSLCSLPSIVRGSCRAVSGLRDTGVLCVGWLVGVVG